MTVDSEVIQLPADQVLPDFIPRRSSSWAEPIISQPNRHFYRQLFDCYFVRKLANPIGFVVTNQGQKTAYNLRLVMEIEQKSTMVLFASTDFPEPPKAYTSYLITPIPRLAIFDDSKVNVSTYGSKSILTIQFGNVQPKARAWSDEPIYIGSTQSQNLDLTAQLFADNLPAPISG